MLQALNPRMLKGFERLYYFRGCFRGGYRRDSLLPSRICLDTHIREEWDIGGDGRP